MNDIDSSLECIPMYTVNPVDELHTVDKSLIFLQDCVQSQDVESKDDTLLLEINHKLDKSQLVQQRTFRLVGLVMFLVSMGLCVLRLSVAFLSNIGVDTSFADGLLVDFLFGLAMQVGFMLILPYFVYKYGLKKTTRQVFLFGNVNRTRLSNILMSVALGFCCFVATIALSMIWRIFIEALGYHTSTSSLPNASVGGLLLSIFVVGVLPSICEEWTFRGGFLTVVNQHFGKKATVLICGIAFGLFHQNILQVFYTAMIGMLLVHLTLTTKSIVPAMIIHFINNSTGTYLSYAQGLGWFGQNFYNLLSTNLIVTTVMFFLVFGIGILLIGLMNNINTEPQKIKPKSTGLMLNLATVTPIVLPSTVLTGTPDIELSCISKYTPTLRDYSFFVGAVVVTVLSTVFSYVWGFGW
ncbi:MAG: CPBP family intramembrane metalloprotease [Firmicutes bacterium]|nr:CPBP family intramembrane metalloprotease [Bacillota bacterium]MCL1953574.1 CPBP family intramembrane metalloprotease [Bacillota bacterium]